MNHSCSLCRAKDPHFLAVDRDRSLRDLHARIGGHDGAGEAFRVGRHIAERCFQLRQRGHNLVAGKRNTDDARRRREDLVEDASEGLCRRHAGLLASLDTCLPCSAVGVPAFTRTTPTRPPVEASGAVPPSRGRNDLIGRKHGRGLCRDYLPTQWQHPVTARLDSRSNRTPPKPSREGLRNLRITRP